VGDQAGVVGRRSVGVSEDVHDALDGGQGSGPSGGAFGGIGQFDSHAVLGDGDRADGEFVVVEG
jgi:hypothetical protein